MKNFAAFVLCFFCFAFIAGAENAVENPDAEVSVKKAVSVKIEGAISSPQTAILGRAMRAAETEKADALIIDIDTPGGDLATTLDIMEMLSNFKGTSVCYVNPDAISAGSFIAVACEKIYFSPRGVAGAAEAVDSGGGDIDESMKRKITSFISAKVRSISGGRERRASVQRAMNDPNFELKIGGKILKKSGELLTLTAVEAEEIYDGKPLFSDGTAENIEGVAKKIFGGADFEIVEFKKTWADEAALVVASFAPVLLGIGLFLIFLDIKSGAFGLMAAGGIALIVLMFLGINLTGLSGHEEMLVFLAGIALIAADIFFAGSIVLAVLGGVIALAALAWGLGGVMPDANDISASAAAFGNGFVKVAEGIALALVLLFIFGRFVRKTPLWRKMVLDSPNDSPASDASQNPIGAGSVGICLDDLKPSGKVDFDGKIFEARAQFGEIARGEKVAVVSKNDFNFTVKKSTEEK